MTTTLPPDQDREHIEVRCTRLDLVPPALQAQLQALAGPDPHAGGRRTPVPELARRRLLARGLLRLVLAERLRIAPPAVRLVAGAHGKPQLSASQRGQHALDFNVSHSGDLVVVALARGREVGVDVEAHDDGLDLDAVVRRFFPGPEADRLLALPAGQRRAAFFRSWCRKEALLKAQGVGLRRAVHEPLTPDPAVPARLPVSAAPGWGLVDLDLDLAGRCSGALVATGRDWTPLVTRWPPVSGGSVRPPMSESVPPGRPVPVETACSR